MRVSIIGSGNVAWHFARKLTYLKIPITIHHRNTLAEEWSTIEGLNSSISLEIPADTTVVIIAVNDTAILEVLSEYSFPKTSTITHTSGSIPMDIFKNLQLLDHGVFYPLQSLTKGYVSNNVPILLEASNQDTLATLKPLADQLSKHVYEVDSRSRRKIHLAAVFASNFVNHQLTIAQEILADEIPLSILKPLTTQTIEKAFALGPAEAQTGPAKRGDNHVIQTHLQEIEEIEVKNIYQMLSNHIQSTHQK